MDMDLVVIFTCVVMVVVAVVVARSVSPSPSLSPTPRLITSNRYRRFLQLSPVCYNPTYPNSFSFFACSICCFLFSSSFRLHFVSLPIVLMGWATSL